MDLPRDPIAADIRVMKRKRRDPLMMEALMESLSGRSPQAIDIAGQQHGMRGRWVSRRVKAEQ
eukprot:949179-Lingulodinium_polyedra.AAC.1